METDPAHLILPLLPSMLGGIIWVFGVATWMGIKERKRLGIVQLDYDHQKELSEAQREIRRPKLFWVNAVLTIFLVVSLALGLFPPAPMFMIGSAIALLINYPSQDEQKRRLKDHAVSVFTVSVIIFAAGVFSGILAGTKMIDAMATTMVSLIPQQHANYLPGLVGITSMPLSLVFTPDTYYFGIIPVLKTAAAHYGINAIEIGRAAILGQMTTGFPLSPLTASTFVLVGLSEVELSDHQKFTFKWAFGTTIIMTIIAILTGSIHI
jgi:CitMHS family citrate-Mg2+:H+ or citrate-Ca2+:H+ symporter